jgi:two-component system, chemotaxis family, sensor kinase CheA
MLLQGKCVFIVEDNAGNLAIASLYLENQGAKVKFSRRGLNIPETVLRQLPVDIILTDLMLPNNVSGFDVFDQLRQVPELANIPIVAVSAADPDVVMPKARQKGFAGYVGKPITPLISQYVAGVLNGKPVWIAESNLSYL